MRDRERFHYTHVGIPRTDVLARLKQEARMRGVPFATHITDLLSDRHAALYGTEQANIWFPRGVQTVREVPAPQPVCPVLGVDEAVVEDNLDVWGMDEDEDEHAGETAPRLPAIR